MRHEVLNQEPAKSARWGQGVDVPVVVVRPNLGDHRDLALLRYLCRVHVAPLNHREPQTHVDLSAAGGPSTAITCDDRGDGDVDRSDCVDTERAVPRDSTEHIVVLIELVRAVLDIWEPVLVLQLFFRALLEAEKA